MSNTVPAKVTPPLLGKVYARRRLYSALNAGDSRLVWIEGPPGAGKTTLAAGYLKWCGRAVLWYQLDAADEDPASFFHYMGLAARRVAPRRRRPLSQLAAEQAAGVQAFAQRYFEVLDRILPADVALVFDNVHELQIDGPLHSIIVAGIERLNATRTVMLLSRAAPPPAYLRLGINRRLKHVDWQMLRLNEEETAGITALLVGKGREAPVHHLHDRTQGWIAGLILLLESAGGAGSDTPAPQAAGMRTLFDYFAAEILARLAPGVRRFLMLTAFFPGFTAPMAEQITGNTRARALLKEFVRLHRFTEERDEGTANYQYHPLFREFLFDHARACWSTAEHAVHAGHAARILEEAGQSESAWHLYREIGDWRSIVNLVLREAPLLVARAQFPTLLHRLAGLPPEMAESEPWIHYWLGMCHLLQAPLKARKSLESAYAGFERRDDAHGLYLSWAAISQSFVVEWANFSAIDPWIAVFVRLHQRHPEFPTPQIERTVVGSLVVALTSRQMNHPMLPAWLVRAERISARSDRAEPPTWWELQLAWYYLWMGQHRRAERAADRFVAIDGQAVSPVLRLFSCLAQAPFQWCFGDAGLAVKLADEGLAVADRYGFAPFEYRLLRQGLYATLARGRTDAAEVYLRRMQALVGHHGRLDSAFFHHASAMTRAQQGDIESAGQHAAEALRLARESGHQFSIASCVYVQFNVALLRDDLATVEARFAELRALAMATRSRTLVLWSRTSAALLALRSGGHRDCITTVAKALRASRRLCGYSQPWVPQHSLARLYAFALAHGIEAHHAGTMIRRLDIAAPDTIAVPETWPYPVRIHTLGRFRVLIGGRPLTFSTKVQRKPLDLLKMLVSLGGREVRESLVCESLWPDAEADAAARALTSTLHRLRRLLGEESVHRQNGLLTLDPRRCSVDAWALERVLAALADACRGTDPQQVFALAGRVLESYPGMFLQDEDDIPRVLVTRERLHARLLRHVEAAARRLVEDAHFEQAIACYQRAIEVDPLRESLYRGLIECLLAARQPAEALRAFDRCRRVLASELQVAPSSGTRLLVRHLLA